MAYAPAPVTVFKLTSKYSPMAPER